MRQPIIINVAVTTFELAHISTMFPHLATQGNIVAATKNVSEGVQEHFLLRQQCCLGWLNIVETYASSNCCCNIVALLNWRFTYLVTSGRH